MLRRAALFFLLLPTVVWAQFNTERLLMIGRSALYYEDYVLSIQYFNQAISAKPYLLSPGITGLLPNITSTTTSEQRQTALKPYSATHTS